MIKISKKRGVALIVAFLIVVAGTVGVFVATRHTTAPAAKGVTPSKVSTQTPTKAKPEVTTIKLAAMGDMLAHDSVVAQAKTASGYDFVPYFSTVRSLYKDADIVFCNQEGDAAGEAYGISGYPSFNGPTQFIDGLSQGAGCNLINTANNHLGDKGQGAIDATLDNWQAKKPLAIAGANHSADEQRQVRYFTVKGVKFAFLAFADFNNNKATNSYGVNIYHDSDLFTSLLKEARANADVLIVSMHWGTEDSSTVNADQRTQVATLAAANADIVIGTGPHVLQSASWTDRADGKKMFVWYSIGNMLSSQLTVDELTGGIAGLTITKNNGVIDISKPTFSPTFMSYSWTPAEKSAENYGARKDLKLTPLKDAGSEITKTLFTNTVSERRSYVTATLGSDVTVTE